ncbi:MAG: tRNA (adenosine(37)-N6)-threonylcarbamoyltransferase complex ATPase subunit type 1 TsaE [Patescibacteria group bacterium]
MEIVTESEEETREAAKEILGKIINGQTRHKATVLALFGDLGSGKTVFVKGISEALGIKERVVSPTFIIERRYSVNYERFSLLIHIDAYRLEKGDDLSALNWRQELEKKDRIVCLEWPENVKEELPRDIFSVYFSALSKERRLITYKDGQKRKK